MNVFAILHQIFSSNNTSEVFCQSSLISLKSNTIQINYHRVRLIEKYPISMTLIIRLFLAV